MLEALYPCKDFGETRALVDVCLKVVPSEIYCLPGANGAGKTTLISLLLNFLTPSSGQVLINGCDARANSAGTSPPGRKYRLRRPGSRH